MIPPIKLRFGLRANMRPWTRRAMPGASPELGYMDRRGPSAEPWSHPDTHLDCHCDPSATSTATATRTATPTVSATATATSTVTTTATVSATPTATSTATPTISPTPTASGSPTASASGTPTTSATPTASSTSTATLSPTPTATETATPTATATSTATQTATPTATPTPPFGTLSVSGNLSFGKVKVNSTASKKLKVKNKGKGTLQVTIGTLDPPFKVISGSRHFQPGEGQDRKRDGSIQSDRDGRRHATNPEHHQRRPQASDAQRDRHRLRKVVRLARLVSMRG